MSALCKTLLATRLIPTQINFNGFTLRKILRIQSYALNRSMTVIGTTTVMLRNICSGAELFAQYLPFLLLPGRRRIATFLMIINAVFTLVILLSQIYYSIYDETLMNTSKVRSLAPIATVMLPEAQA